MSSPDGHANEWHSTRTPRPTSRGFGFGRCVPGEAPDSRIACGDMIEQRPVSARASAGRGRPLAPLEPSASAAARLGAELRGLRVADGLMLAGLSVRVGYSGQYISQVEHARTAPTKTTHATRPTTTATRRPSCRSGSTWARATSTPVTCCWPQASRPPYEPPAKRCSTYAAHHRRRVRCSLGGGDRITRDR